MPTEQTDPPPAIDRGQVCPVCRLPPSSTVEHRTGGLIVLELACGMGHIWQTKWVLVGD